MKNRIAYVTSCCVDVGFIAEGCSQFSSSDNPVTRWCRQHDVTIKAMPCPESLYLGIGRSKKGKADYDTDQFRAICRNIAHAVVSQIGHDLSQGHEVVAIFYVRRSPSCSGQVENPNPYDTYGILAELIDEGLKTLGVVVPRYTIHEKNNRQLRLTLDKLTHKLEQSA